MPRKQVNLVGSWKGPVHIEIDLARGEAENRAIIRQWILERYGANIRDDFALLFKNSFGELTKLEATTLQEAFDIARRDLNDRFVGLRVEQSAEIKPPRLRNVGN